MIAGGHTLVPVMKQRLASPPHLVDLSHIEGLDAIEIKGRALVIGATESYLPQERVKEISRRIPHATFASVEGSHAFHEERPSKFLAVVEPFIAWFAK